MPGRKIFLLIHLILPINKNISSHLFCKSRSIALENWSFERTLIKKCALALLCVKGFVSNDRFQSQLKGNPSKRNVDLMYGERISSAGMDLEKQNFKVANSSKPLP